MNSDILHDLAAHSSSLSEEAKKAMRDAHEKEKSLLRARYEAELSALKHKYDALVEKCHDIQESKDHYKKTANELGAALQTQTQEAERCKAALQEMRAQKADLDAQVALQRDQIAAILQQHSAVVHSYLQLAESLPQYASIASLIRFVINNSTRPQ